ncbi:hypothetical protein NDU88_004203 [Pleurodeles waltl]|uniref:Uncharacterized protein n=1 Tax=Pleurodeles waltl TaxID=8319 RepID=A0AAV7QES3_PLEWA|nr:hypothetical protein NDU88_004203 [Pleurodeles waltl]
MALPGPVLLVSRCCQALAPRAPAAFDAQVLPRARRGSSADSSSSSVPTGPGSQVLPVPPELSVLPEPVRATIPKDASSRTRLDCTKCGHGRGSPQSSLPLPSHSRGRSSDSCSLQQQAVARGPATARSIESIKSGYRSKMSEQATTKAGKRGRGSNGRRRQRRRF